MYIVFRAMFINRLCSFRQNDDDDDDDNSVTLREQKDKKAIHVYPSNLRVNVNKFSNSFHTALTICTSVKVT